MHIYVIFTWYLTPLYHPISLYGDHSRAPQKPTSAHNHHKNSAYNNTRHGKDLVCGRWENLFTNINEGWIHNVNFKVAIFICSDMVFGIISSDQLRRETMTYEDVPLSVGVLVDFVGHRLMMGRVLCFNEGPWINRVWTGQRTRWRRLRVKVD